MLRLMRAIVALSLPLAFALPTIAANWLTTNKLPQVRAATAKDVARVVAVLNKHSATAVHLFDGMPKTLKNISVIDGDVTINTNWRNNEIVIALGNVTINGSYQGYSSNGHLIVLGSMKVEHCLHWGTLFVEKTLDASGLVFGYYNDFTFEVPGQLNARGVVSRDKSTDVKIGKVGFYVNSHDLNESEGKHLLTLEPELMTDGSNLELDDNSSPGSLYPDYDITSTRVTEGKSIFRSTAADKSLLADVATAINPKSAASSLQPLIKKDRLLAQLIAARPKLAKALHQPLLATNDPIVHRWLALADPALALKPGVEMTEKIAESIVTNQATTPAQLKQLLSSKSADVRKALFRRDDLPLDFLETLAADTEPPIRERAAHNWLSDARRAALVTDKSDGVRESVAKVALTFAQSKALAEDTSIKVQQALANSLTEQSLRSNLSRMTDAERVQLAESLLRSKDKKVTTAAFLALPAAKQEKQFDALVSRKALNLFDVALMTTSHSVMDHIMKIATGKQQALLESLATNLAIPARLERSIFDAAKAQLTAHLAKKRPGRTAVESILEDRDLHALKALEVLVGRDDALPEIIDSTPDLAIQVGIEPADGSYQNTLFHQRRMPAETIAKLDRKLAGNRDWALTLLLQANANRQQLERAVKGWYNDADLQREFKAITAKSGDDFWVALARAKHEDLYEIIAYNYSVPEVAIREYAKRFPDELEKLSSLPNTPKELVAKALAQNVERTLDSPKVTNEQIAQLTLSAQRLSTRYKALEVQGQRWRRGFAAQGR